jgi:hypothetical protein
MQWQCKHLYIMSNSIQTGREEHLLVHLFHQLTRQRLRAVLKYFHLQLLLQTAWDLARGQLLSGVCYLTICELQTNPKTELRTFTSWLRGAPLAQSSFLLDQALDSSLFHWWWFFSLLRLWEVRVIFWRSLDAWWLLNVILWRNFNRRTTFVRSLKGDFRWSLTLLLE